MKNTLLVSAAFAGVCVITGVTCGPAFLAAAAAGFLWNVRMCPKSAPAKMAEWMKEERRREWNEMKKARGF